MQEKKTIKLFIIKISYGTWSFEYNMAACHPCSAISKAISVWGERMRVSARPASLKRKS